MFVSLPCPSNPLTLFNVKADVFCSLSSSRPMYDSHLSYTSCIDSKISILTRSSLSVSLPPSLRMFYAATTRSPSRSPPPSTSLVVPPRTPPEVLLSVSVSFSSDLELVRAADPFCLMCVCGTYSTVSPRTPSLTSELSETTTLLISLGLPTTRSVHFLFDRTFPARVGADKYFDSLRWCAIGGCQVCLPGLQGPEDRSLRRRHHRTRPVRRRLPLLYINTIHH